MNQSSTGIGQGGSEAFKAYQAASAELLKQRTERAEQLRGVLDEVKTQLADHSALQRSGGLEGLQKALATGSSVFAGIHCGRTTKLTSYEECSAGYPVQLGSVRFCAELLKLLAGSQGNLTETATLKVLKPIQQLSDSTEQLAKIAQLEGDALRTGVEKFASDAAKTLRDLAPQGEHTLPVGAPGCGMFLRCIRLGRDSYRLYLYNASEDAHLRQGGQGEGVRSEARPLYVFDHVPADALYFEHDGKLRSPLLTQLSALTVRRSNAVGLNTVLGFLKPLEGYRKAANERYIEHFLRCQRANFSSQKALNGLLLHMCGEDRKAYKRFCMDARLFSLVAEMQRNDTLTTPQRKQLRIAAENLLKSVMKYASGVAPILGLDEAKRLLGTALAALERLDRADAEAKAQCEAKSSASVRRSQAGEGEATAKRAAADVDHPSPVQVEKSKLKDHNTAPRAPEKSAELLASLQSLTEYLEACKGGPGGFNELDGTSGHPLYIHLLNPTGMLAVERFLRELPAPGSDFWAEIPAEQTIACMKILSNVQQSYAARLADPKAPSFFSDRKCTVGKNRPHTAVQQLTLFNLYANLHCLALKADAESGRDLLSRFAVHTSRFTQALELDPLHGLDDYAMLERRRDIERYFKHCSALADNYELFSWKHRGAEPFGDDAAFYAALLKDGGVKEKVKKFKLDDIAAEWAVSDPTMAALLTDETRPDAVKKRLCSLLNIDMGHREVLGWEVTGDWSKYLINKSKEETRFAVAFGKDESYRSYTPESVLGAACPYIGILKQASLMHAVLFDVNAERAREPIVQDSEIPLYDIDEHTRRHCSKRMPQRVDIWQDPSNENELELICFGRCLPFKEEQEKLGSIQDKRAHLTGELLSPADVGAACDLVGTGALSLHNYEHKSQNHALASAASSDSIEWELAELVSEAATAPHNLLQWLRHNPLYLRDAKMRARVQALLFRPRLDADYELTVPVLDLLKHDPDHLVAQLRNLVGEAVTRFYTAQPHKRADVEPLVFVLNLAQQFERSYTQAHGHRLDQPLFAPELFDQVFDLQDGAKAYTEREQLLLQLSQFTQRLPSSAPEQLTDKQLQQAALAWIRLVDAGALQKGEELGAKQLARLREGSEQLVAEYLRRKSDEGFVSEFCDSLRKGLGLAFELKPSGNYAQALWGNDGNVQWYVDLAKGEVYRDGVPTKRGAKLPEDCRLWKQLLLGRKHEYRYQKGKHYGSGCINFRDSVYGSMRYFEYKKLLQRQVGDAWYTAVEPGGHAASSLVPSCLQAGYSHWVAEKPGEGAPNVLICDLETGRPLYEQDAEGRLFQLCADAKRPVLRDLQFNHFDRFYSRGSYLAMGQGDEATEIQFPQWQTADGEVVSFERRGGRWVYSADPSYSVAEKQIDGLVEGHSHYLLLERADGRRRILMLEADKLYAAAYDSALTIVHAAIDSWSRSKIHRCVRAFDCMDKGLCAEPMEDTLYLVWQLLVSKDYDGAVAQLQRLGAGSTSSPQAEAFVNRIVHCEKDANDYSPEACAVRLRCVWLAKLLNPDFKIASGAKLRTLEQIFSDYCHGIERIPAALQLSERMLTDLGLKLPTARQKWQLKDAEAAPAEFPSWESATQLPFFIEVPKTRPPEGRRLDRYRADGALESYFMKGSEKGNCEWPVAGETDFSLAQFTRIYDELRNPDMEPKLRKELAYRLFTSSVEGYGEAKGNPSIARLKVLYCLYKCPNLAAKAPELPEDNASLEQWWKWNSQMHELFTKGSEDSTVPLHHLVSFDKARKMDVMATEARASAKPVAAKRIELDASELPLKGDLSLEQLLGSYFDTEERTLPEKLAPLVPPSGEKLSKEDAEHSAAIGTEFDAYNGDVDTSRAQEKAQPLYVLKDGKDGKQLLADLSCFLDKQHGLEASLLKEEQEIIALLIAPRQAQSREDLEAFARQESPLIRTSSITDIMRAAVKGTPAAYRALNPYLSDEAIREIHAQSLEYMLRVSSCQQLKRCRSLLSDWDKSSNESEREALWQKAVEALSATRQYPHATWKDLNDNAYSLYFEYKAALRMRVKQAALLNEIMDCLTGKKTMEGKDLQQLIFQLMMGGGKTSVILSVLLDLISEMQDSMAVLILHPSQFDAVLGNLQKYQKERFGKELIPFDYSRAELNDVKTVQRFYEKLLLAKSDHNGVAMKSNMPQVVLLELRKIAADLRSKKITPQDAPTEITRASYLAKILKLMRNEAVFLTDEVDLVLNIIQQLNFPKGEKQHLPLERILLTTQLFDAMRELGLMHFGEDTPQIDREQYDAEFSKPLSEASYKLRNVPEQHKEAYLRYVRNEIDGELEVYALGAGRNTDLPATLSEQERADVAYLRYLHGEKIGQKEAGLHALSHFMISKVIPQILSLEADRHIGYHPSGNGKVIPYLGRKNPAATELANPDEAVAAGALCVLSLGIPDHAIQLLAEKMAATAEEHALIYGGFDKTPEARQFRKLTGVALGRARHGMDISAAAEQLEKHPEHALRLQANLDLLHVTYHNEFLTSEAYDIPAIPKANISCTGTPQSKDSFARIRHAILDEGTEGKILDRLRRLGQNRETQILKSEGSATNNTLDIIAKDERYGALIDTGGTLKGVTGEQFARAYLQRFKNDPKRCSVVFFHRYTDRHGKQRACFAALRRNLETDAIDAKPVLLKDTTPEALANAGVERESMFVFFEESKCTGTDFVLRPTCRGLISFNPTNQTFRKTAQGALREREIWFGQDLDFLMPEAYLGYYHDKTPNSDQILSTCLVNQAVEKSRLTTRSLRERLRHVAKRKVQEGLIDRAAEATPEDYNELAKFVDGDNGYGRYLDTQFEGNLLQQFGRLSRRVDALPHLKDVAAEEAAQLSELDPQLHAEVLEEHKKLLVEAERVKKTGYLTEQMDAPTYGPGFGTQMQVAVEAQKAQQNEQQQEQQVQVELQIQNQLNFYARKQNYRDAKEKAWQNLDQLDGKLPGEAQGVANYQVGDYLNETRKRYYQGLCYTECFSKTPLYMSENFVRSVQTGESFEGPAIFSPAHKRISHLLVARDEDGKPQLLALSNKDFDAWRDHINASKKDYWIVNLDGELAAGAGQLRNGGDYSFCNELQSHPDFKSALWHANFFNGNLFYLERNPELTRSIMLSGGVDSTEARRNFLKLRAGSNQTKLRQLDTSHCLNPLNVEASSAALCFQSSIEPSKAAAQQLAWPTVKQKQVLPKKPVRNIALQHLGSSEEGDREQQTSPRVSPREQEGNEAEQREQRTPSPRQSPVTSQPSPRVSPEKPQDPPPPAKSGFFTRLAGVIGAAFSSIASSRIWRFGRMRSVQVVLLAGLVSSVAYWRFGRR